MDRAEDADDNKEKRQLDCHGHRCVEEGRGVCRLFPSLAKDKLAAHAISTDLEEVLKLSWGYFPLVDTRTIVGSYVRGISSGCSPYNYSNQAYDIQNNPVMQYPSMSIWPRVSFCGLQSMGGAYIGGVGRPYSGSASGHYDTWRAPELLTVVPAGHISKDSGLRIKAKSDEYRDKQDCQRLGDVHNRLQDIMGVLQVQIHAIGRWRRARELAHGQLKPVMRYSNIPL